jgi:hypothetical protein
MRVPLISLMAAGALALGGCAYGDGYSSIGLGYGSGYGSYGGYYGGYGGYGGYYNSGYGGYYGSPYYGWYDNFYYPGTGYYVYDVYRRPHRWSDHQRDYWTNRQRTYTTNVQTRTHRAPALRDNWSAFRQQRAADRDTRRAARHH